MAMIAMMALWTEQVWLTAICASILTVATAVWLGKES
jgi:hypothetical protein